MVAVIGNGTELNELEILKVAMKVAIYSKFVCVEINSASFGFFFFFVTI